MDSTVSGRPAHVDPSDRPVVPPPRSVPAAIAAGVIICTAGGFATGRLLTVHPIFGVALVGVGLLAGFVSRKITGSASRQAGQWLIAACVLAFCISMVSWYRWGLTLPADDGGRREPTWQEAVANTPRLMLRLQAPQTMLISGIAAAFGASEAFRQAGRRYRIVHVVEE